MRRNRSHTFQREFFVRITSLLILAAIPWFATLQAAEVTPEEQQSFEAARKAFQDANYAVARQFLAEFVEQFPMSERLPEALLYQARSLLELGHGEDSIALLKERLQNSAKVADQYRYWIGEVEMRRTNYLAAAEQFAMLLKNHPDSSRRLEAAYGEARARFKLKEWSKVVELLSPPQGVFSEASNTRSNDELSVAGRLILMEALLQLHEFAKAEEASRSLEKRTLAPGMKWRHEQLRLRLLLESHRYDEALGQSSNAVAAAAATGLPSPAAESQSMKAEVLRRLNRLDEAAQVYELNLAASTPSLWQREAVLHLLQLNLAQNRFIQATQRLESILLSSPGNTYQDVALLTYGELYLREYARAIAGDSTNAASTTIPPGATTNLLNESLSRFDRLLQLQPASPLSGLAQLYRGWAFWAQSRLRDSLEAFRTAAQTLPFSEEQAVAQLKWGEVQVRLLDYTNALVTLREFTNRFSSLPRVQNTLLDQALHHMVRIGLELKDKAVANHALESLLAWKPKSEFVEPSLLLMGERYSLSQQPAEARDWLGRVPAKSPLKPMAELVLANTYTQEGLFTNALEHYSRWLERFPQSELRPRVEYDLATATYRAGQESNAFALFTTFLEQRPSDALAPRAQYWIGEHYLREGNYTNAEIQFQQLYQSTNWPVSELTYLGKMQAGRAAFARLGFSKAQGIFTEIVNDNPPFPELVAKAYFALGDCFMMQSTVSTNVYDEYLKAATAFGNITRLFGTNEVAPRAWGNLGNCFLQLARQDAEYYRKATNAYSQVLAHPASGVAERSQAEVGMGLVLMKFAETYSPGKERDSLTDQAQSWFLRVFYEKNIRSNEQADPAWQKEAGFEAARLAESSNDLVAAIGIYERLKQIVPPLAPEAERRIARLKTKSN